ncbi:terminase [Cumulibacter soli]|uniref:terminase n=1 Tax=Cumulibacter soli TaxID=2546344 RepID=UPI0010671C89|nr:terminase [Cumulibacter soli]
MSTATLSPSDRLATLPDGLPELTLGWEAVKWAGKYLRHPNGPRVGERWKFVPSQVRFLLWFYAVDEQGRWLFNRAVRRLAKGAGKSPNAGAMALIEFCGPVRLKDFDPKRPGGCVGKPVDMPLVQIVATAESQTANTMRMVRAMCAKGSRLSMDYHIDVGKTQFYRLPEGTLETITSSARAAEGAEATFLVADETEHWSVSNGGRDLMETVEDNLIKSGSRLIETANAWVPGSGSEAERTYDAWVAQEEGRTKGEQRILYDARIAPPDTDLGDEASLLSALDWVYDDCFWVPKWEIAQKILDGRTTADNARRKYLNMPTAVANAWVTQQDWATLADPSEVVADGDAVVLFFDGSKSRDATALSGCRISDGYSFEIKVWEPDLEVDGWTVPADDVDAHVAQAMDRFDVWAFFADVREWESFVKLSWPEKYGDQLRVWAQKGGQDPQVIAWDMRSRSYLFTRAVELVEQEIYDKTFRHDGAAITARHVANARRKLNQYGTSIGKETKDSPLKIDAAVTMIGARMVRNLVLASSEWKSGSTPERTNEAAFF